MEFTLHQRVGYAARKAFALPQLAGGSETMGFTLPQRVGSAARKAFTLPQRVGYAARKAFALPQRVGGSAQRAEGGLAPALLLALLFFAAPAHAEILIAVAGPMSGQYAVLGNHMKTGAEAAIAAINAGGGINGETLTLLSADDACDTKRAADIAKDFASKDVRLAVGHFCSGASRAAALIYEQSGIMMITPSASLPALTDQGLWNVLRLTGRDDAQAMLAATRIAAETPAPKVAIISDESSTAKILVTGFQSKLQTALAFSIKQGAADYTDTAAKIVAEAPSVIYLATSANDAGQLASDLAAAGFAGRLYGNDALISEAFSAKAAEASEGTRATFPMDPQTVPAAQATIAALQAQGKSTEGATLPTYAAIESFAAAARARSVNDARAMADWLKSGTPVQTVLGSIAFDAKGDLQQQPFVWYQWQNGSAQAEQP